MIITTSIDDHICVSDHNSCSSLCCPAITLCLSRAVSKEHTAMLLHLLSPFSSIASVYFFVSDAQTHIQSLSIMCKDLLSLPFSDGWLVSLWQTLSNVLAVQNSPPTPHSSCASSVYVYFCEIEAGGTPQPNGPPVQEMNMKIIWKQGKSRGIKVWNKQKLGN